MESVQLICEYIIKISHNGEGAVLSKVLPVQNLLDGHPITFYHKIREKAQF